MDKYAQIAALSQQLKQAEISLCWGLREGNREVINAARQERREIIENLRTVG